MPIEVTATSGRFARLARIVFPLWIAAVMFAGLVSAQPAPANSVRLHYTAAEIDYSGLIGPPPAPGSAAAKRDIQQVLEIQATRSKLDCVQANVDAELSLFDPFTDIFGKNATAEAMPKTTEFLTSLAEDTFAIVPSIKATYNRARPNEVDPSVRPCIVQPNTSAYPSGHAMFIYTIALALSDMAPERRSQIFARADTFAFNRVIGGIHFNSDAYAARTAAALYYSYAKTDLAFGPAFTKARLEFRAKVQLPPELVRDAAPQR